MTVDVLRPRCPSCFAKPGKPCLSTRGGTAGNVKSFVHPKRAKLARKRAAA